MAVQPFTSTPAIHRWASTTPPNGAYEPIPRPAGLVLLNEQKAAGKLVKKNLGASLVDLGDGVACVEFHTKMNTLDADVLGMLNEALDCAVLDFDGLVIGSEAENFSAGANLFLAVMAAQGGMWDHLQKMVKGMQDMNMRMRYFPKPVVWLLPGWR